MALAPEQDNFLSNEFEIKIFPTKTYEMHFEDDETQSRIYGFTDGQSAMKQAIYLALNTERFEYPAYSDNYGFESKSLIGMPMSYVLPELKRLITECLTWDSRIDSVDNFYFDVSKTKVKTKFTVHTIYGEMYAEKEVSV